MIQIHDKKFELYLSESHISDAVNNVATALNKDYTGKQVVLLAILNGSFMFCSTLAKKLTCQPEIHFIKLQSYEGTQSSGQVKTMIGMPKSLKNRHVVIVEDIVDTGQTLAELDAILKKEQVKSYETATLLYKPKAFFGKNPPKFVGIEIPNNFVVGFGLDYDGLGRELPEIYKIKE